MGRSGEGIDGDGTFEISKTGPTIKNEVCNAVLGFLNEGTFNYVLNQTYIVLIKKKKKKTPYSITDYRPIRLCNVIYKIIVKVIANRLKTVLPNIISPYQSAFVKGRLIIDNALIVFKALHTMNGRMKGIKGYMVLKLDMSKAYDRV